MTTTRERKEARAERLREYADKRNAAAAATFKAHEHYRGDTAFNTQPGHIPERARVIRREDAAFRSMNKAANMTDRAAGIEAQLDNSIYSDDPDAVEAIEARVKVLEDKRDKMKRVNALYRKGDAAGLAELGLDLDKLREQVATSCYAGFVKVPFAPYELTNLGGNIRRLRQRIPAIKRQQARTEAAEAAPDGVTITATDLETGDQWTVVTFAEKPAREIIDALKAGGYRWGGGSWHGYGSKLPAELRAD